MHTILLPTNPQWCHEILRGRKLIEVRKSRPAPNEPFKVLLYCTKNKKEMFWYSKALMVPYRYVDNHSHNLFDIPLNGMVVGEFICDKITTYTAEFVEPKLKCYEDIVEYFYDENAPFHPSCDIPSRIITSIDEADPNDCELLRKSCLNFDQLRAYIGINFHEIPFYGWHISGAKAYDQPKELSEYRIPCKKYFDNNSSCGECQYYTPSGGESGEPENCACDGYKPILHTPQSWCYVDGRT